MVIDFDNKNWNCKSRFCTNQNVDIIPLEVAICLLNKLMNAIAGIVKSVNWTQSSFFYRQPLYLDAEAKRAFVKRYFVGHVPCSEMGGFHDCDGLSYGVHDRNSAIAQILQY